MSDYNIEKHYTVELESESKRLGYLSQGMGEKQTIVNNLNKTSMTKALFYLENKQIVQSKQAFFTCGRIDEYVMNVFDDSFLEWDINRPSVAILSDNRSLIQRYGYLRFKSGPNKLSMEELMEKGSIAPMSSLLLAMAEDWEGLEEDLAIIREKALTKKKNAYMEPDYAFLLGLLHRNKAEIESSLQEMMTPARLKQRHYDPLFAQYLALPAAGYIKLAWIHGFEIKIEHKLLPAELFPVNPNPVYEDAYDFLKELPN